jgi:hypothetical protein
MKTIMGGHQLGFLVEERCNHLARLNRLSQKILNID